MSGVSNIFSAVSAEKNVTLCACSYFDGEMSEEEKLKIEFKSEEEEEDVTPGQKKATLKSQR